MSARAVITKDDVTRICLGLEAAGRKVTRVVVSAGQVSILTDAASRFAAEANPWDKDLEEESRP